MQVNQKVSYSLIKILKTIRLQRKLSQSDLAFLLKVPQSFVSKYESGERSLAFDEVWEILHTLNFSQKEFVEKMKKELKDKNDIK